MSMTRKHAAQYLDKSIAGCENWILEGQNKKQRPNAMVSRVHVETQAPDVVSMGLTGSLNAKHAGTGGDSLNAATCLFGFSGRDQSKVWVYVAGLVPAFLLPCHGSTRAFVRIDRYKPYLWGQPMAEGG